MADLIPRAAARDVINTWGRKENENVRMDLLHNDLNAIPAVDAVPVVHGRWVIDTAFGNDVMSNGRMVLCSECGQGRFTGKTNYCPNCGAKMDGGAEL